MTIIQISLVGSGTAPSGNWNNVTAPGTTGQKVADLIDSSGAPTGVSLWLIAGGTATTQSAATATYHGLPKEYWNNFWISALDATLSLELRGMPAGASYSIDASGYNLNGRDSDITVEGSTQEYSTAGTADAPEAPVTLTGTVPGDGILAISSTKSAVDGQFYGYLNGLVVDYTASATPTITTADNITDETQPATVTLANNTAAPTVITINGTAATGITDQGAGVYSYTPPLIADDATATLAVTVDGETLTTTISYANSYPYELVTHGTPNANSIFSGTQFATNGPVEWGVVTGYDPAIVIVDHAAMDVAEDELNDVAMHSTEVAAGTATATYKYFVPESGAAGTWQSEITVTDGVTPPVDPPEDDWPYGLGIRPTAPKTWLWGKRHPKTGMRTRLYK